MCNEISFGGDPNISSEFIYIVFIHYTLCYHVFNNSVMFSSCAINH